MRIYVYIRYVNICQMTPIHMKHCQMTPGHSSKLAAYILYVYINEYIYIVHVAM